MNTDQTIRFGSVRYSGPPGLLGHEVWGRPRTTSWSSWPTPTPHWSRWPGTGCPQLAPPAIELAHYPDHPQTPDGGPRPPKPRASSRAEAAFLALGPGAHSWLVEAAAAGAQRVGQR